MTICKTHRVTWDEQQSDSTDECEDCGRLRHEHPVYTTKEQDPPKAYSRGTPVRTLTLAHRTAKSQLPWWFELPYDIWILVDISNSNPKSKNYLWWFETKALAMEHKEWQNEVRKGAELRGPFYFSMGRGQAEQVQEHLTEAQEKAFWALDFLMQAPEYKDATDFLKDAIEVVKNLKEER